MVYLSQIQLISAGFELIKVLVFFFLLLIGRGEKNYFVGLSIEISNFYVSRYKTVDKAFFTNFKF